METEFVIVIYYCFDPKYEQTFVARWLRSTFLTEGPSIGLYLQNVRHNLQVALDQFIAKKSDKQMKLISQIQFVL